jgi:hypothetical protein
MANLMVRNTVADYATYRSAFEPGWKLAVTESYIFKQRSNLP